MKKEEIGYKCAGIINSKDISGYAPYFGAITTSSYQINHWGTPTEVGHTIFDDRIEFVYTQEKLYIGIEISESRRVFKIIYSCKDGHWHKSERIYGKIIAPQEEQFEFDD